MESAVLRMCGGAAPDHHGNLRIVLQYALSEVTKENLR